MTAIGKLLALLNLVAGLGVLTWSVNLYVERPGWFEKAPDGGIDKGNNPVVFDQMKTETEALGRAAGLASDAWGTHLKALEERERYRADRRAAFDERRRWAYKGNLKDPVDPANPKSPGKGFYEPVVDSTSKLYDLSVDAKGVPKGKAVIGTDGAPLPGLEGLAGSISGDTAEIVKLTDETIAQRAELNNLNAQVTLAQARLLKMGEIRDHVQGELFFLSSFEVNVFETRETVIRREKQLRKGLKVLGISDP